MSISFSRRMQRGSAVAEALADPWKCRASLPVEIPSNGMDRRGRSLLPSVPVTLWGPGQVSSSTSVGTTCLKGCRGNRTRPKACPIHGRVLIGFVSRNRQCRVPRPSATGSTRWSAARSLSSASLETKNETMWTSRNGVRERPSNLGSFNYRLYTVSLSTSRSFWLCCKVFA